MGSKPKRKNMRQGDFRIVARGVPRPKPDISRLMRASLDHYLATRAEAEERERGGTQEKSDGAA